MASDEDVVQVVARQVRARRDGRGWSGARLAEEMTRLGVPWDRSTVAKLETGRRSVVSVPELLALAVALEVTPAALLVDLGAEQAQVTPDFYVLPYELLAWLWGRASLPGRPVSQWQDGEDVESVLNVWSWLETSRRMEQGGNGEVGRIIARNNRMLRSAVEAAQQSGIAVPAEITDYLAEHADG